MSINTMPNPTVAIVTSGGSITVNNITGAYKFAVLPSWHKAENKGMDLNFTLVADSTILKGGSHELTSGKIVVLSQDGDTYGVFNTDTIKPNADGTAIYVTCIDAVQRLAYQGQTVYRDYYDADPGSYVTNGSWNSADSTIYFSVAAGSIEDPSDVAVDVNRMEEYTESAGYPFENDLDIPSSTSLVNYITCKYYSAGFDMIYKITVKVSCNTSNVGQYLRAYSVTSSGSIISYLGQSGPVPTSEGEVDIVFSPYALSNHAAYIRIYAYHTSTVNQSIFKFPIIRTNAGDAVTFYYTLGQVFSGTWDDCVFKSYAYGASYATVTAGIQTDQVYSISSIAGVSSLSLSMLLPAWANRIAYTSIVSSTTTSAVISGILNAVGFVSTLYSPPSSSILKFRSAGADTLTMLQTLSDMGSTDGSARACFASSSSGNNIIKIGTRLSMNSESLYNLVYPGDNLSLNNQIEILNGTPNLNMSTRKPICLTTGTKSVSNADGSTTIVPIMFAMVDFSSLNAMGSSKLEQVSSGTSVSTEYAAAKESYGTVMDARGKDWSGTLILSGFWPDLMSRVDSSYGSGVPITIYNSCWGMYGYKARIIEMTISWEDCTTTVELNNYSIRYSNKISSASNMAVVASGYSIEGASGNAFSTQYALIYVESAQIISNTTNTVQLTLVNGSSATVSATTVKAPELGGVVISATFLPESVYDNTHAHSAIYVRINSNSTITIPAQIRPDKRRSQTLIVNLAIPSSLITYSG
ncbi:MAG: hypothetical protein LHW59_10325 [Candidatus Cloacimonetes bacterium]|nr:hypothetical protein [Candidatus Cloacimonadota bacterium]